MSKNLQFAAALEELGGEPPYPALGLLAPNTWEEAFVTQTKTIYDRIAALSAERSIVVWGAGAKGTTFVQLVDPQAERIDALVDVHPGKQSRYVPGSGHRIERPEWLQSGPPRTALVMNPAYVEEIRAWLDQHGSPVLLEATGSA